MTTRAFWAPGRVNLIGEYTDLVGGLVLPAALDLGVRIEGTPAEQITIRSEQFDDVAVGAADGTGFTGSGWTRYVAAVAHELDRLGRPALGIDAQLTSTLPVGAGLSSSAALSVGVATTLCGIADFELEPLELAQAARRAERRAVGVPLGILDQAAAVLGRAGCAVLLDTGSLEHELVELPSGVALVVLDSGFPRMLETSAYAQRKRELDEALAHGAADETLARRLRHIETENGRVLAVVDALRSQDLDRLGDLFRAGHASLRDDLEVTVPALDRLVALSYARGALAARMTGGGFGGSVVALVDVADAPRFADAVMAEYGPRGHAYVCEASDGARELS